MQIHSDLFTQCGECAHRNGEGWSRERCCPTPRSQGNRAPSTAKAFGQSSAGAWREAAEDPASSASGHSGLADCARRFCLPVLRSRVVAGEIC
jgi:hypothetical protein